MKPVALYMMCDPITTAATPPVYHQPLWSILMSLDNQQLLNDCIPWIQVS